MDETYLKVPSRPCGRLGSYYVLAGLEADSPVAGENQTGSGGSRNKSDGKSGEYAEHGWRI